jgi:hypothetical protein
MTLVNDYACGLIFDDFVIPVVVAVNTLLAVSPRTRAIFEAFSALPLFEWLSLARTPLL